MANVFQPDRAHLTAKGYEAVAHVPVIFDSNGGYLREHNRYLRERAMLKWHPGGGGDVPSERTLENIADCLVNFVKWCEARGADWRTIGYDRVLGYARSPGAPLRRRAPARRPPLALTPCSQSTGIISLIPGAAVAGGRGRRRAHQTRAKSEASLVGEHDGGKGKPKTKALGVRRPDPCVSPSILH
jgi:hypothetical protein